MYSKQLFPLLISIYAVTVHEFSSPFSLFTCPPIPMTLTLFLFPLLQASLSPEGRDLIESSHLGLSISRSLTLCNLSGCGSLLFPHLLIFNFKLLHNNYRIFLVYIDFFWIIRYPLYPSWKPFSSMLSALNVILCKLLALYF